MSVNVLGSFAFGVIVQIGLSSNWLPDELRLALTMGFLGAFTTFSTFSYETYRYAESGLWCSALANMMGNLVPGLLAVWLGLVLGRWIVAWGS